MVIRRRSFCPWRSGRRQGRFAWGLAEAPSALVRPVLIVAPDPAIEVGLQLGDRAVDPLSERHAVELVQHRLVEALDDSIIRYENGGAFLVRLFSLEDGTMVSPSGTRGTGSTKVRAGRQQTLG